MDWRAPLKKEPPPETSTGGVGVGVRHETKQVVLILTVGTRVMEIALDESGARTFALQITQAADLVSEPESRIVLPS